MKITIDPEFAARIPPLRPEERAQLEANLIAEGCRDPLVIWRETGVLIDGHNRYEICKAHNILFETATVDLPDREAAEDWIDANQLGRRNLSPEHYSLLRGRRYNRAKKSHGGEREPSGQNAHLPKTAERLAEQYGVDESTIRRDGRFAEAVEAIKAVDPEIEAKVIRGAAPPKAAIVEAAKVLQAAEEEAEEAESVPLIASPELPPDPRPAARAEAAAILNGERRRGPNPEPPSGDVPEFERPTNGAKAQAVLIGDAPAPLDWEAKADHFESAVNKLRGYAAALKKIEELDRNHYHFTAKQRKAHIHSLECIRQNIDHAISYLKGPRP